ncbi:MAG: NAD(P)/FAD-dependent oxidoreductase [Thermomicrobiales bacterium]
MSPLDHEQEPPVVVVGGGLAGLTAALSLHRRGIPVTILESSDAVGGRVRTDMHADGYLLDRGFQVLLDAYPAVRRQIDIDSLQLGRFDAGAVVWDGNRRRVVASPLAEPRSLLSTVRSGLIRPRDGIELARLGLQARRASWSSVTDAIESLDNDVSIQALLTDRHFSDQFVQRFARPFWGGITLDRNLSTSAGVLLFTLKMFLEGSAALPARGMQAIPGELAAGLPAGAIRTGMEVSSLRIEAGRATGVVAGSREVPARAVIVAVDPLAARKLAGISSIPEQGVGCRTFYFAGTRDSGLGRKLLLNGEHYATVNQIAPLSNVCPSYAPRGHHLLAVVVLESTQENIDHDLPARVQADVARLLGHAESDWTRLSDVFVPFSQFRQPPGFSQNVPGNRAPTPGLYLAGDYTRDSSINGAIISGEQAADAVLADLALV